MDKNLGTRGPAAPSTGAPIQPTPRRRCHRQNRWKVPVWRTFTSTGVVVVPAFPGQPVRSVHLLLLCECFVEQDSGLFVGCWVRAREVEAQVAAGGFSGEPLITTSNDESLGFGVFDQSIEVDLIW